MTGSWQQNTKSSLRVLFLTQYGMLAASSRTRVFQYLPYFQRRGVEYRVITVLPDREIPGSQLLVSSNRWRKLWYYLWASWRTLATGLQLWWLAPEYHLLFVQKVILPAPVRLLLRLRRSLLFFDFDDAIFTTEVQHLNWLAAWKLRRNAGGVPAMLALADRAVVENEYTGSFAARFCPVTTITGPIDTERYQPAEKPHHRKVLVLGWIGSTTTLPYLFLISEPLQKLGQRFSCLRLRVVGAVGVTIEGLSVDSKAWRLEEEVDDLQSFDIGIMPLPDDPWTRGKGGYKLLQYMAVGLPVVTSPVGINRQLVRDGDDGFWARSPAEWEARLAQLITDPSLRARMGKKGRARAQARYALNSSSERLLAAMKQPARPAKTAPSRR